MPDLRAILRLPFKAQIAAFRLRLGNLVPTARWDDIMHSAHDRAFMVAGATKAELLADLAGAVDKAIAEGTGLQAFQKDFRGIVEKHGWHGWTGEETKAGRFWRSRVIYRTNMATSYAAGRMAQLVEGNYPFWVYLHGAALEPRQHHLALDGMVLPPDHPFWATHAPPNGWGCTCYILGARSAAGARRLGGDPDKELPPNWDRIDPKTGAPVGIDRGWAYAPGASANDTIRDLRAKLDFLPPQPSVDLIQSWLRLPAFDAWLKAPQGNWPLVRIPAADATAIRSERVVADLSADTARKQETEHPELSALEYAIAQAVIDGATHRIQDGERAMIYVLVDPENAGNVLVVKATASGKGLFITSFHRLSSRKRERARELRRLLGKRK